MKHFSLLSFSLVTMIGLQSCATQTRTHDQANEQPAACQNVYRAPASPTDLFANRLPNFLSEWNKTACEEILTKKSNNPTGQLNLEVMEGIAMGAKTEGAKKLIMAQYEAGAFTNRTSALDFQEKLDAMIAEEANHPAANRFDPEKIDRYLTAMADIVYGHAHGDVKLPRELWGPLSKLPEVERVRLAEAVKGASHNELEDLEKAIEEVVKREGTEKGLKTVEEKLKECGSPIVTSNALDSIDLVGGKLALRENSSHYTKATKLLPF